MAANLPYPIVWIVATLALVVLSQWAPGLALALAALALLALFFANLSKWR